MPNALRNLLSFVKAGSRYLKETRDVTPADRFSIRKRDARALLHQLGIDFSCPEKAAFDANGPSIYVLNHSSLLDALCILSSFEMDIRILAKSSVFKLPYIGSVLKREHHICVHRGKHAADRNAAIRAQIHDALAEGASIAIFPEGTRTATGALGNFKHGAFYNAIQNGVHVVPVVIRGTFQAMPKTTFKILPGNCSLELLTPIEPPDETMGDEATRAQWMADQAKAAMEKALANRL